MTDLTLTGPLSPSVGDYLKAIWELAETGAASTREIADLLSVAPASVTNMLGRLRGRGLVDYEPYHGALLTRRGREEALQLVRPHRLIETFLLEHLAEFLGHPDHDSHGDPIPTVDGTMPPERCAPWTASSPSRTKTETLMLWKNRWRVRYSSGKPPGVKPATWALRRIARIASL
jgi:Mn-dependent DtxR family transcriptional regulator